MIIRHAEKPDDRDARGIDASGREDSKSLTAAGWRRANALAAVFDPAPSEPMRAGLSRPTTIFAAAPDGASGVRPTETVAPLADRLHAAVDTRYGKGDEKALARTIKATPGVVLVCWQHGEIPDIVKKLGDATPAPPQRWSDSRFDVVWVFTRGADGWRFSQVPQLLLPGDSAEPMTGRGK